MQSILIWLRLFLQEAQKENRLRRTQAVCHQ